MLESTRKEIDDELSRARTVHPRTPSYYHALGALEEELFELKWCILHRPGSIIAGEKYVARKSIREEFMSMAVVCIRAMEECMWQLGDKGKFPEE